MGDEAITEYKLERTGDALVQFTGQLIAQGSSHSDEGPRSDTWHEVTSTRPAEGNGSVISGLTVAPTRSAPL